MNLESHPQNFEPHKKDIEHHKKDRNLSPFRKMQQWVTVGALATFGLLEGCDQSKIDNLCATLREGPKKPDVEVINEVKESPIISRSTISYDEFLKTENWKEACDGAKGMENSIKVIIYEALAEIKKIKDKQIENPGDNTNEANREKSIKEFEDFLKQCYVYLDKYENITPQSLYKEYVSSYQYYDAQRNWLVTLVNSPKYGERIVTEYSGDTTEAGMALKIRKNRIEESRYKVILGPNVSNTAIAHYIPSTDSVEFPSSFDREKERGLGVHEFTHSMTLGGLVMSTSAKDIFLSAFTKQNFSEEEKSISDRSLKESGLDYYANPTELDARKKELEYDMEKLGIKKYEEDFTDTHYQKILELQKQGKLSSGADQFLRMIKPEYLKLIMNTIAENVIKVDPKEWFPEENTSYA